MFVNKQLANNKQTTSAEQLIEKMVEEAEKLDAGAEDSGSKEGSVDGLQNGQNGESESPQKVLKKVKTEFVSFFKIILPSRRPWLRSL